MTVGTRLKALKKNNFIGRTLLPPQSNKQNKTPIPQQNKKIATPPNKIKRKKVYSLPKRTPSKRVRQSQPYQLPLHKLAPPSCTWTTLAPKGCKDNRPEIRERTRALHNSDFLIHPLVANGYHRIYTAQRIVAIQISTTQWHYPTELMAKGS